jgi:molybdopterin-guanine dinucleotide biosynthesis protein B
VTPYVSIVGKSDAGKTTLIEKLIVALRARGLRVGTIKHDVHGFEVDREGKDSWRHAQAGADSVLISSPQGLALIKRVERERTLVELTEEFFADVDIVLTEGYKRESTVRVEVHRAAHSPELISTADELLALATDEPLDLDVPQFDLNDAAGLADFLIATLICGGESMAREDQLPQVEVIADGRSIDTKPFVCALLASTVRGILEALRDVPEPERVRVQIAADEHSAKLEVNGAAVPINRFVTRYVCGTVAGMVGSLEGAEGATKIELKITCR